MEYSIIQELAGDNSEETLSIYQRTEDILERTSIAMGESETSYETTYSDTKTININNGIEGE